MGRVVNMQVLSAKRLSSSSITAIWNSISDKLCDHSYQCCHQVLLQAAKSSLATVVAENAMLRNKAENVLALQAEKEALTSELQLLSVRTD